MENTTVPGANLGQTQVPPINPPTTPKKWLFILGALLMLVLGAVVALAYQNYQLKQQLAQTPEVTITEPIPVADPTANWVPYVDAQNAFHFKYPANFSIADGILDTAEKSSTIELRSDTSSSYLIVWKMKTDQTLAEYVASSAEKSPAPVTNTALPSSMQWMGSYKNAPTHYAAVAYNDSLYLVGLVAVEDPTLFDEANSQFLDQILSTFEFTSAKQVSDPQVCSNNDLQISITIPADWRCVSKEDVGAGWITLTSNIFTIEMSKLGRGGYCEGPDPLCTVTKFYTNAYTGVDLDLHQYDGRNKEIFGQGEGRVPWVSVKWTGMETKDLTTDEKTQLFQVLNSLQQLE